MASARLEARVQPGSSRNEIAVVGQGKLRVYVTAPPEGGKANRAAISLLAQRLGVAKSSIRVLRGQRKRNKVLLVEGLEVSGITTRLESKRGS